ncbi:MAG: TlpA disulfide reductase family protein [Anaerolineales bacterium]
MVQICDLREQAKGLPNVTQICDLRRKRYKYYRGKMKFLQALQKNWLILTALTLGLGWIALSRAPQNSLSAGKIPAPQAGFTAPAVELPDLNGNPVRLADLRGQVVLLNIWATWCPPCRAEMPAIQRAYEAYRAQGFTVLAVNSTVQDDAAKIAPFLAEYGLSFPVLLDEKGLVTRTYQINSLPTSFFIGRDGLIREVIVGGPMDEALLKTRIETLLKEKP